MKQGHLLFHSWSTLSLQKVFSILRGAVPFYLEALVSFGKPLIKISWRPFASESGLEFGSDKHSDETVAEILKILKKMYS